MSASEHIQPIQMGRTTASALTLRTSGFSYRVRNRNDGEDRQHKIKATFQSLPEEPMQLQMFMTGKELKNAINISFDRDYDWIEEHPQMESMDEMWDRKALEASMPHSWAHGSGVYESLSTEGWREGSAPLTLLHVGNYGRRVPDAHHRIAAAAQMEELEGKQIFFPVVHDTEDPEYLKSFHSDNLHDFISTRQMGKE